MNEKFEEIINKRKQFNGKPFEHWQEQADELVIEAIMRAGLNTEQRSIIGYIAGKRLLEIAKAENPTMFEKLLKIRAACIEGFARVMASILHP